MNKNNILYKIKNKVNSAAIALIDPDKEHDKKLPKMLDLINDTNFDAIFVGGSTILDNKYEERILFIKNNTSLPVIIFPGSSNQISKYADSILFLTLISGRNPQFLIDEHVKASPYIYKLGIETISTGYILIESGKETTVQKTSKTQPLSQNNKESILAHALAGQYIGNKMIFLDNGSGATNNIKSEIILYLKKYIEIPIIVGGGIRNKKSASDLSKAGADYIVIGSKIEELPSIEELISITNLIHNPN